MLSASQRQRHTSPGTIECRAWPHIEADGPFQMGLDEAMLESVAAAPTSALWRTYTWSEPTLSLGYFQSAQALNCDPRWQGLPFLRRPTGGAAILHDQEITYALALPRSHPFAQTAETLYEAVHQAIVRVLRAAGAPDVCLGGPSEKNQHARPLLCFTERGSLDIVLRGVKIVGSAQRRRSSTVLQHGSLLLRRSSLTPELLGLSDLAAVSVDAQSWSATLHHAVPRELGLLVCEEAVADSQRSKALSLAETVYRNPAWNHRR
jgi:lipoate-protein ligase A